MGNQRASTAAGPEVVFGSSTSGLLPTDMQQGMTHPERLVVGHPFNPVYLLPLVEIVGGERTSGATIEAAKAFYTFIGMHALHVRREVPGHLTDRLQEALWREILHLVNDGVASTGELDESIIYGPGLRWAAMGTNLIYHLAGGETGMRHMLAQFGPCLKWPWTKLEAPELTEQLIDRMVEGTQAQADGRSIRDLERLRDDYLVAIQQVLRQFDIGAGRTLKALETRLYTDAAEATFNGARPDPAGPLRLVSTEVRPEWIDYNGHMTDSRYMQVFGDAMDVLYRRVGVDEAYRQSGHMFFTVESHISYLTEAQVNEPIYVTTQILGLDSKRLHVFHRLLRERDNELVASCEQMHLHVDTQAHKAALIRPEVLARLEAMRAPHVALPRPAQAGRSIGIPAR